MACNHIPDLFNRFYFEISDAIDLLGNVTAAEGSEDDLGCAELALQRVREVLVTGGTPRLIAEAAAMLAALRKAVTDDILPEPLFLEVAAILARIDGET